MLAASELAVRPREEKKKRKSFLERFVLEKDGVADKQTQIAYFGPVFGQREELFALYRDAATSRVNHASASGRKWKRPEGGGWGGLTGSVNN